MNNNLIITHKDGRTWNEGQLGDLLKDAGITQFDDILGLGFRAWRKAWYINISDHTVPPPHYREFTLDPSLYTVSPVGMNSSGEGAGNGGGNGRYRRALL